MTLELGTPRANGPFGARLGATSFDLTLRNSRGDSVEVELDADDAEGHCSFSLPEAVTVPPGGATTVTVKVRPRARRLRGEREIRWFSVMASSGEGGQPPATVSGQFEDLPYGWVPYGGAALGALAAALLAVGVAQGIGGGGNGSGQTPTPQAQNPGATATPPVVVATQPTAPEDSVVLAEEGRPAELSATTATGKIAFGYSTNESFNFSDIYVIDADGSGLQNLTNSEFANDDEPTWSPDGSRIAFVSDSDQSRANTSTAYDRDIYIMSSDGSARANLTNMEEQNLFPCYPPDDELTEMERLAILNKIAMKESLGNYNSCTPAVEAPAWSPDGSRIAFEFASDIWVIDLDGTGLKNLTNSESEVVDSDPTWSPDSSRIAFSSYRSRDGSGTRESFFRDIYIMNADGSGETNLTDDVLHESQLSWSPDGKHIAFRRGEQASIVDDTHDGELYLLDIESGMSSLILTPDRSAPFSLSWSPDGGYFAISDGWEILILTADGSSIFNVTQTSPDGQEVNPAWAPET